MQAHMVSFFKEQIFVFHAISELFPSEITSSNLMQNMPGCHCRDLVKLRELAVPTNLQKQCHLHSIMLPRSMLTDRDSATSERGALLSRVTESLTLTVGATQSPSLGTLKRKGTNVFFLLLCLCSWNESPLMILFLRLGRCFHKPYSGEVKAFPFHPMGSWYFLCCPHVWAYTALTEIHEAHCGSGREDMRPTC